MSDKDTLARLDFLRNALVELEDQNGFLMDRISELQDSIQDLIEDNHKLSHKVELLENPTVMWSAVERKLKNK